MSVTDNVATTRMNGRPEEGRATDDSTGIWGQPSHPSRLPWQVSSSPESSPAERKGVSPDAYRTYTSRKPSRAVLTGQSTARTGRAERGSQSARSGRKRGLAPDPQAGPQQRSEAERYDRRCGAVAYLVVIQSAIAIVRSIVIFSSSIVSPPLVNVVGIGGARVVVRGGAASILLLRPPCPPYGTTHRTFRASNGGIRF